MNGCLVSMQNGALGVLDLEPKRRPFVHKKCMEPSPMQ